MDPWLTARIVAAWRLLSLLAAIYWARLRAHGKRIEAIEDAWRWE
jgi:hypothetical protein